MKTLRKTGFGGLPGFTDVGGGDGGLRRFVVTRGASPLLSLDAVHSLSPSPLAAGHSPSLFSLFLFPFLFGFSLVFPDRKSTRLNSSHSGESRMPSSA